MQVRPLSEILFREIGFKLFDRKNTRKFSGIFVHASMRKLLTWCYNPLGGGSNTESGDKQSSVEFGTVNCVFSASDTLMPWLVGQ